MLLSVKDTQINQQAAKKNKFMKHETHNLRQEHA